MSDLLWNKQGETLSHKNACQEFGLTEEEVFDAMKSGKLQYRENSAHGNPYFRLLRNEVKLLAQDLHRDKSAKEQEMKYELQKINREINSLKENSHLWKSRKLN